MVEMATMAYQARLVRMERMAQMAEMEWLERRGILVSLELLVFEAHLDLLAQALQEWSTLAGD